MSRSMVTAIRWSNDAGRVPALRDAALSLAKRIAAIMAALRAAPHIGMCGYDGRRDGGAARCTAAGRNPRLRWGASSSLPPPLAHGLRRVAQQLGRPLLVAAGEVACRGDGVVVEVEDGGRAHALSPRK